MNSSLCLVVIFNHRYDRNLPVLEEMYRNRFSNRFYLVPFYDGTQENVIPVYNRSIFFEGYIAQGCNVFYKKEYKHYLFIADDMLINPEINEDNYQDFFELTESQSYIPELRSINKFGSWIGTWSSVFYVRKQKYLEIDNELPSREIALSKMELQGISQAPVKRFDIFGPLNFHLKALNARFVMAMRILTRIKHPFRKYYSLPYPMVGSYSDIVMVSADDIKSFAHYCGVFSATCLFVEVAIPTALVLATNTKIKTENEMRHKGRAYWLNSQNVLSKDATYTWNNLERDYKDLDDLIDRFPKDAIYIHPIKLSKWMKR